MRTNRPVEKSTPYHISKFMAERIRLDDSASDKRKREAYAALEKILNDLGKLLDGSAKIEPRQALNTIHDYVEKTYRYEYLERPGSIVEAINDHVLNCEVISSLFFEVGLGLKFPISMRAALAFPINHAFVSWELGNGNRILWEPLSKGNERREYATDLEVIGMLANIVQPVATHTIEYKPEDVLASDLIRRAQDIASKARLFPLLGEDLRTKHDEALEMAKNLSPENPGLYMRTALNNGDRKIAVENGRLLGGDEYADFIDSLWDGEGAIIVQLNRINTKLEAMGIQGNRTVVTNLLRKRMDFW